MSEENASPDFQWSHLLSPGVVLVIIGVVGYIFSETPLESVRPVTSLDDVPPPPYAEPIPSIHARLWEDPLTASYVDWKRQSREPNTHPIEVQQLRSVLGAVLSDAKQEDKKVLVLPALIPGGPSDDEGEQRLRMRYAVVSALATCGYKLSLPQRMSYTVVPIEIDQLELNQRLVRDLVVPIKLFSRSDASRGAEHGAYDYVFVLWINELQLGDRPLAVIGQVLEQLFGTVRNDDTLIPFHRIFGPPPPRHAPPKVCILGPSDSDCLFEIARESAEWDDLGKRTPAGAPSSNVYRHVTGTDYFKSYATQLYSPRATISGAQGKKAQFHYEALMVPGPHRRTGIQSVVRTIGTDAMLVKALKHELVLRGKWSCGSDAHPSPIVLVTEVDSLYGEAFPRLLRDELCNGRTTPPDRLLKLFKYERGIDGKLPGTAAEPTRKGVDPVDKDSPSKAPASDSPNERPTGRSQVDYLRRLEMQLVALDADLRLEGSPGIEAIGVAGTDVYDKLLVLRALRKRFPDVCFFATDLDAALSEKSELHTARNLVVASHFGLTLHPELQRDVPPFRDSYQTSLYFSTLLALEDGRAKKALNPGDASPDVLADPWGLRNSTEPGSRLSPLIFEIGRHGPYQLTTTGPRSKSGSVVAAVHPRSPREHPWLTFGRFVLFLVAAVAMVACLFAFVTPVRRSVMAAANAFYDRWQKDKPTALLIVVAVPLLVFGPVGLIHADHSAMDGEPFAWDEGISLWPVTAIRYVVACMAVGLAVLARRDLKKNENHLLHEYTQAGAAPKEPPVFSREFVRAFFYPLSRLWKRTEDSEPGASSTREFLFPWAWGPDPDDPEQQTPALDTLTIFDQYLQRTAILYRLARSIRLSLFYFVFASTLMWVTASAPPTRPYRGPLSNGVSLIVLVGAVLLMMWLVFFVLDRMQLCRRFIRLLQSSEPNWASSGITRMRNRSNARLWDVRQVATVRVIAEHTNAVMKIIYYPFLLVLLMVVARSSLFDYLNLPVPLALILLLLLASLVLSACAVRRGAHLAREEIIARMRGALRGALADKSASLRAEQLKHFIVEIQREQRGAYGPVVRDPIVGSIALVFGGSGGLLLLQRFLPDLIF